MFETSFKLIIFIDGENLLYGCKKYAKDKHLTKPFKYDEDKLVQVLTELRPKGYEDERRRLVEVRFYTAKAEVDPSRPEDERRFKGQEAFEKYLTHQKKWRVFSKIVKAYSAR